MVQTIGKEGKTKQRSIGMMILLTIVTFGIYMIYWNVVFQQELKDKAGQGFGGLGHLIMLLVTFGIYGVYWQYAAGKRLAAAGGTDNSVLYLVLAFIVGFVNPFLMQNEANQLA